MRISCSFIKIFRGIFRKKFKNLLVMRKLSTTCNHKNATNNNKKSNHFIWKIVIFTPLKQIKVLTRTTKTILSNLISKSLTISLVYTLGNNWKAIKIKVWERNKTWSKPIEGTGQQQYTDNNLQLSASLDHRQRPRPQRRQFGRRRRPVGSLEARNAYRIVDGRFCWCCYCWSRRTFEGSFKIENAAARPSLMSSHFPGSVPLRDLRGIREVYCLHRNKLTFLGRRRLVTLLLKLFYLLQLVRNPSF